MIVKIEKCDNPEFWYSNRIGQTFEVFQSQSDYVLKEDVYKMIRRNIAVSDCSLVPSEPESPQEFKEGQWCYSKCDGCEIIFRYTEKAATERYFIDFNGQAFEDNKKCYTGFQIATPEQIERILSAVWFLKNNTNTHMPSLKYRADIDQLWNGYLIVYSKGIWAKIVDQDKPESGLNKENPIVKTRKEYFEKTYGPNAQPIMKDKAPLTIEEKPIDKVTLDILDTALRICDIQIHRSILDKVIDVVELLEEKGDQASLMDFANLKAEWQKPRGTI